MAATKRNAMLIEETRKRVQTSQLINRLQDHGFGKIELAPTQIKAIEILLKKTLPDLQSVSAEVTGADGKDLIPPESVDPQKLALGILAIMQAAKPKDEG